MLKKDKDIFVISDLHLGDHSKRDNFSLKGQDKHGNEVNRIDVLNGFLDMVEKQNGQLVILGDLFEFWQANIGEVIRVNIPLLDRLASMGAIYVIGNHDIDLEPLIENQKAIFKHPFFAQMTTSFTFEINGKTFKFFHGHEVDPYNQGNKPAWGRMMAIMAGIVEDKLGAKFSEESSTEDALVKLGLHVKSGVLSIFNSIKNKIGLDEHDKNLTPAQNKGLVSEHFDHMDTERQKNEFDVAVCGHTHMPGKLENWYINSGSWIKFKNSEPVGDFVWIYQSGEYDVCTYTNEIVDYIQTEFVRNAETGLVHNFDFENGRPIG